MSQKRYISDDIWHDPTFSKLTLMERLLWVGLITVADDYGYVHVSAAAILGGIFPHDEKVTLKHVRDWRTGLAEKNKNFHLFNVDGIEYGHFIKWRQYQSAWKPSPPRMPPCPICPTTDLVPNTDQELAKIRSKSVKGRAKTGPKSGAKMASSSSNSVGVDVEVDVGDLGKVARWQPTFAVLKGVVGYQLEPEKDLAMLDALAEEFPSVNVVAEIKKWATAKLDRPLGPTSSPRSQLRNWMLKSIEFSARDTAPPNVSDKVPSVREQLAARGITR